MGSCVAKVQDGEHDNTGDNSTNSETNSKLFSKVPDEIKDGEHDNSTNSKLFSKCLVNLPTELLVKILFHLPIHERIRIRYVCRRFQDVCEMPLLWKKFVWSYKPRHVCMVSNVLKVCGEQVRQIYFPDHVTPTWILEMACYCVKATHLSLPQDTQLALDHLEQIVHTMTQLQQLDVFAYGNFIQEENPMMPWWLY